MKKWILLLFVASFFTRFDLNAQNLTVTHDGNPVLNGSTIDLSGHIDSTLIVEARVYNTGGAAVEVKLRKEEISAVSGSMNTFCFAGNCYGGSTTVSLTSANIPAGGFDSTFSADYYPLSNSGTTIIRYTFFNINNSNDTISFTVRFTGTLGLPTIPGFTLPALSQAYPNPATDKVSFQYTNPLEGNTLLLVIRDFTGRTIRETRIPSGEGVAEFYLAEFESGVYFYSLIQNQQVVLTRKLVVKK
jgi:hypothetical protein